MLIDHTSLNILLVHFQSLSDKKRYNFQLERHTDHVMLVNSTGVTMLQQP